MMSYSVAFRLTLLYAHTCCIRRSDDRSKVLPRNLAVAIIKTCLIGHESLRRIRDTCLQFRLPWLTKNQSPSARRALHDSRPF
jgi:hypothetical protein